MGREGGGEGLSVPGMKIKKQLRGGAGQAGVATKERRGEELGGCAQGHFRAPILAPQAWFKVSGRTLSGVESQRFPEWCGVV